MISVSAFGLLFLVLGWVHSGQIKYTPKVSTLSGPVVGLVSGSSLGDVYYFLGIPYGQPPTGDLRFQRPKPAEKWNDILEATELPKSCPQPRTSIRYVRRGMSEDCLYLNIITPPGALKDQNSRRPVMIDLGRNFFYNSGAGTDFIDQLYPLVLKQDVIVVTVDFRKNIFGFAYTSADDGLNGNYGMWDQNLAMNWVKDNIKSFGGDPNRVTVTGTVLGSAMIEGHIFSPFARGLFQNAILESETLTVLNEKVNERVEESTYIVMDRVNCKNAKDRLACLQDVDMEDLISALPNRFSAFQPVPDSDYIPVTAEDISNMKTGNDKPNVNLLFGYGKGEDGLIVASVAPNIFADQRLTYSDAEDFIATYFEDGSVDKLAESYIGDKNGVISIRKIQEGLMNLVTDVLVSCPLIRDARALADGQQKGMTYFFVFNHYANTKAFPICDLQPELGICPKDIIIFNYGIPYTDDYFFSYTPEDRKMADVLMNVWGNFARTGSPSANNNDWSSWNGKKSNSPVAILTSKGSTIDRSISNYCLENVQKLEDSLIDPKYYPLDQYTIPKQTKVDYNSSYDGLLFDELYYMAFQHY
ncbi:acetylcholinesterase-like [Brevipalpus obovatus]|uniref:acetylcholinesterase-like n=1 Tax=Brevipalpus obovatus TaxID=246614 RepID=UPI003D9EDAFE